MVEELKQKALGVKDRIKGDSLSLVAAGVAFYIFLSIFPALASAMSVYGLVADPQTVERHINAISAFVPAEVLEIISERLTSIAETQEGSLTIGLIAGVLVSLWSANRAMKAIAKSLNIAYEVKEERGFIKFNLITLGLTVLASVVFIVGISVVVFMPVFVSVFLSDGPATVMTSLLSWSLFLIMLMGLCTVLYRVAPDRPKRPWRQALPGAFITSIMFIIASVGFSFYVSNFGNFDEQYGTLGAVVITMLWLFIGAFIFLIGAEINAERLNPSRNRRSAGLQST